MQAHEEKVEERKLHGVRGKLRRALRASNPEDQRVIYATGRVAAESWSEEVVRALGSRMPGGLSNVTVPCKFCASIFYPCLCIGGVRDVPHRRGLVAPRIAHEAEVRRLHNQPMGHLRELATSLDMCGMDKDILHVSGPADIDTDGDVLKKIFKHTSRRATGDKTAQCKLWFERDQRERVTRSAAAVRHKHCTEKDVAGGPDVDLELFHTWLSSKNLSPSHSKFVFRRLLGSVRQELANFERKRTYRLETMLSKSIRCVDLMEREKKLKSERESGPLLKRRLAEIKMEVDVCEQEIAYLFDQVPPSFLEDITDLADTMKQTLPADMSTTDCAVDSRQSRSLPKSMILNVVSWQDAKKTLTEKVGDAMPDSDKKRLKEAFNHLAEKASTYKEQLRGRGKKRSADAYDDMVSQEDGRLSEKEFARVILLSGVNWLGMDEIQFLFSSMDKDKSGKLNLGELLCTAMRVIDLSDRLQRFVDDNKDLSQANCLLEFGHLLKMGSDLVGPKSHPLVPDSRISASSYFLNDAEHGFQQMWRSRLDCQDTCWVGESHDKDEHPWIQWRFSSPCKIQAISTKGRPDSDAWVIKYRVEYVTHALLDDDDDDEKELSDTLKWESYSEEDGKIFHFDGNADRHTRKDSFLRYPFVTSAVRLFPLEYRGRYPAMRASLYGSFTHLSAHDLALDQTKQPEV
ncbi:unnamed protein product [Effrenium voratum]|uniref:Uncharacterized protein n=1 Tax=Effrenium voratum TaxID=2562239 RepID=A0AA36JL34_9DINO|nr:unnamed protein product [Effrenium voratum]